MQKTSASKHTDVVQGAQSISPNDAQLQFHSRGILIRQDGKSPRPPRRCEDGIACVWAVDEVSLIEIESLSLVSKHSSFFGNTPCFSDLRELAWRPFATKAPGWTDGLTSTRQIWKARKEFRVGEHEIDDA